MSANTLLAGFNKGDSHCLPKVDTCMYGDYFSKADFLIPEGRNIKTLYSLKMVVVCCVPGCRFRSGQKTYQQQAFERENGSVKFFRLPTTCDERRRWYTAMKRPLQNNYMADKICSNHFSVDSFKRHSNGVLELKDGAYPSIFDASTDGEQEDVGNVVKSPDPKGPTSDVGLNKENQTPEIGGLQTPCRPRILPRSKSVANKDEELQIHQPSPGTTAAYAAKVGTTRKPLKVTNLNLVNCVSFHKRVPSITPSSAGASQAYNSGVNRLLRHEPSILCKKRRSLEPLQHLIENKFNQCKRSKTTMLEDSSIISLKRPSTLRMQHGDILQSVLLETPPEITESKERPDTFVCDIPTTLLPSTLRMQHADILQPVLLETPPEITESEERPDTFGCDIPTTLLPSTLRMQHADILQKVLLETPPESTESEERPDTFVCDIPTTSALEPLPTSQSAPRNNMPPKTSLDCDTPREIRLKKILEKARQRNKKLAKKIRILEQGRRRSKRKIHCLKRIIKQKGKQQLITNEDMETLKKMGKFNEEFLVRQIQHLRGLSILRKYGPDPRAFACTLHYYSPRAYKFVREKFRGSLPHPKTITSWYMGVDGQPGFTKEAFKALAAKVKSNPRLKLHAALTVDEMAIRKHVDKNFEGYVDMGEGTHSEDRVIASQAFVFLLTAINGGWKLPVGYFLVHALKGTEKAALVTKCLTLTHEAGVRAPSFTFDGTAANWTMARTLGCSFRLNDFRPWFDHPSTKEKLYVFLDPCHMVKLVRNTYAEKGKDEEEEEEVEGNKLEEAQLVEEELCEEVEEELCEEEEEELCEEEEEELCKEEEEEQLTKGIRKRKKVWKEKGLFNSSGGRICWSYVEELHKLQQVEGVHAANKITGQHVHYKRQKMKVRLAAQVLSLSTAKTIQLCREMGLKEFQGSEATCEFLEKFDTLFDILISKSEDATGCKKALCKENKDEIFKFFDEMTEYIKGLHFDPEYPMESCVLNTDRKTGFLGFIICMESAKMMFQDLCEKPDTSVPFLALYKISQDHIELLFGLVRARGGWNNNPSSRHFKAAYKRILCHFELHKEDNGNCIPLENVSILYCSSASKHPDKMINLTAGKGAFAATDLLETEDDPDDPDPVFNADNAADHFYTLEPEELTLFVQNVVAYIGGFVVKSLVKSAAKLKCKDCIAALTHDPIEQHRFLLDAKNRGKLYIPGKDVVAIAEKCEKIVRSIVHAYDSSLISRDYSSVKLTNQLMATYAEPGSRRVFESLDEHVREQDPLANHRYYLVRCIAMRYFNLRLHHLVTLKQKYGRFYHTLAQ